MKRQEIGMHFFRMPFFWHPDNPQKIYLRTPTHYLWFLKCQKHYKLGEKQANINLDQFLTQCLDQFLTQGTPNLGPVFDSLSLLYIYIAGNLTGWVAFRIEDVRETEGEKQN